MLSFLSVSGKFCSSPHSHSGAFCFSSATGHSKILLRSGARYSSAKLQLWNKLQCYSSQKVTALERSTATELGKSTPVFQMGQHNIILSLDFSPRIFLSVQFPNFQSQYGLIVLKRVTYAKCNPRFNANICFVKT